MNARTHSLTERVITDYFVFASLADEPRQATADISGKSGILQLGEIDAGEGNAFDYIPLIDVVFRSGPQQFLIGSQSQGQRNYSGDQQER